MRGANFHFFGEAKQLIKIIPVKAFGTNLHIRKLQLSYHISLLQQHMDQCSS